ncbi:hypothetical protein D6827_02360 [Candidatus Parcubacteria bacterium]|nr:MAG: hypothetical protein D6827_02360 [Candidatus Parcubacteria bacterium]
MRNALNKHLSPDAVGRATTTITGAQALHAIFRATGCAPFNVNGNAWYFKHNGQVFYVKVSPFNRRGQFVVGGSDHKFTKGININCSVSELVQKIKEVINLYKGRIK